MKRTAIAGTGPWTAIIFFLGAAALGACEGDGGDGADADAGDLIIGDDVAAEADAREEGDEGPDVIPDGADGCTYACDTEGATRCAGDVVQACGVSAAGCLAWTDVESCAEAGLVCAEAGGEASCRPPGTLLESKGMWAWGTSIRGSEASFLGLMADHSITDVFILVKGGSGTIAYDVLDALVAERNARGYGMRIWAWVIAFNDASYDDGWDTDWVDPEDAAYRSDLFGHVDEMLQGHTPDGIMLDCIRYPGNASGNTAPITSFCQELRTRVDAFNAEHSAQVLAGAAVMPEFGGGNESAYGQDVEQMAPPLDVVAPMIYRYNYASSVSWITSMTEAALAEAGGAADVWPILQNYAGDDSPTPLSEAGLRADIEAALQPCPTGFSIFQYTLLTDAQWNALDATSAGDVVCGGTDPDPPPPAGNLDIAVYHQQPLSSNDDGPFYGTDSYEGWCNTASLYMVLHSFIPDLPARLRALDPSWTSWRGGGLPDADPYFYDGGTTYNVEEFLQDRYLGYLIGSSGIGFPGIQTMLDGVGRDFGVTLAWQDVPVADLKTYLLDGWFAIMNNWEWGGHYFVVVWYEAGSNPDDPAQRYYYILDPTNIEAGNDDILSNVDWDRTASFRSLIQSRQTCGSVSCSNERLGIFVLNANGVNAVLRDAQTPGTVPMVRME